MNSIVLKSSPCMSVTMGCKRRRCTSTTTAKSVDDLPEDLLDVILARLPLRDAARASVLSVAWARAWRRLSDLDFTATCGSGSREAIDAVLRHHSGPVRRARLKFTDAHRPADVRRWTLSLLSQSQRPEEEEEEGQQRLLQALDLAFCDSGPPPPLQDVLALAPAACTRALRDLALARCVLPAAAAGGLSFFFPSLTSLRLTLVSVHDGSDLEAMVAMSPKLEELAMECIDVLARRRRRYQLRMASQSIRFLEMSELQQMDWVSACLPRVEHARLLNVDPDSAANILQGMASSVHKLVYYNYYYYLKIELPKGFPSSYANLNSLELQVNFSYGPEITSMIYFLKSAPNLTQLVVNDFVTDESSEESPPYHWPPLGSYEICPNLRFLHMTALFPRRNALDFMRLVLSSARMLQILKVGTAKRTGNQQIADELRRYDRVSPGVQISVTRSYVK